MLAAKSLMRLTNCRWLLDVVEPVASTRLRLGTAAVVDALDLLAEDGPAAAAFSEESGPSGGGSWTSYRSASMSGQSSLPVLVSPRVSGSGWRRNSLSTHCVTAPSGSRRSAHRPRLFSATDASGAVDTCRRPLAVDRALAALRRSVRHTRAVYNKISEHNKPMYIP